MKLTFLARVRDDAARLGEVGLVGKHHGAETEAGDFERTLAEVSILHGDLMKREESKA